MGAAVFRRVVEAGFAVTLLASSGVAQAAGEEEVGLKPVAVEDREYRFDSAEQHGVSARVIARGLSHLYSLAFLPDGDALLVERGSRLRLLRGAISDKPDLVADGLGGVPDYSRQEHVHPDDVLGIQDIALHPGFASNRLIYLTYNKPMAFDAKAGRLTVATILARARLDGMRLVEMKDLMTGEPVIGAGGSRIQFGRDGLVHVSVGALSTGDIMSAQRVDNIYGKVLRLNDDGTPASGNPFARRKGARAEILTYGHRDPLGMAIDPQGGALLASEHGPQGGDELNQILPGRNYGWPISTYGNEYGGSPLPHAPVKAGTQGPNMVWLPAIAPSGIAFYSGERFARWKNNLFIASARRGQINGTGALIRVVFNDKLQELRQEVLFDGLHQRFKDVRQGPDGLLYAVTDEDNAVVLRLAPAPE
ncbi:PQQ-dependent sugar dehydrogenase [Novosphingobium taihuense]|uniref:Glucose/arabinose dehydrogenase n=1 Tax=Novosphingobium taihuense TaxID=260085 RepID=A0A7W7EUF0_9SPHN|nr:PQQ-dependent sugar dehydrogenase [Novosphingobium taihuense]MBB4613969.1 glucose/arabinose dehydrogenase [Novosphingobium taihuense]TWH86820.1 glucose/arabinose dehydrogenase [Novosphingobium taihuense]